MRAFRFHWAYSMAICTITERKGPKITLLLQKITRDLSRTIM